MAETVIAGDMANVAGPENESRFIGGGVTCVAGRFEICVGMATSGDAGSSAGVGTMLCFKTGTFFNDNGFFAMMMAAAISGAVAI